MQRTKALTEGALLTGLFIVLMLMALWVPVINMIVLWFLPLPFIVYVVRHGVGAGLVMWGVAFLLSFIISGLFGFPFTFFFGAGGIIVGEMIRRKKEALAVLVGGSLAYIFGLLLLYIGSIVLFDINVVQTSQEMMRQSMETAENMLGGLGQETDEEAMAVWREALDQLQYLIPVILILTGITFALVTQLIAHVILRRLREPVEPFPPFREVNFPRSLLWYYLVAAVLVIVGLEEGTSMYIVVANIFPILELAMTIQGITVMFTYTHAKSMSKALPILLVIVGIFLPFILYLIRILGIIDLGFNLKKRIETDKK
ncbi:YybS family protein [Thalassorhabdus alkalitolerans]|uniref:YybS family protein n=1 Tax=Thalassorhabdus alkalitolerans TaxID=2282697 RepID=A0ABW0YME4_9BACI|nr:MULTISPECIES: YybS family protein [Bacillaceae]